MEDVEHVIRRCPVSAKIWEDLLPRGVWASLENVNFDAWLNINLSGRVKHQRDGMWSTTLAIATRWIWKWINEWVFCQVQKQHEYKVRWIKTQAMEVNKTFAKVATPGGTSEHHVLRNIGWKKPQAGWTKLNTDGSIRGNGSNAGCGGILRNEAGAWLGGFTFHIGQCSILEAEIWGVINGLRLAWDKGYKRLVVETDCKRAVHWITGEGVAKGPLHNVIRQCKDLLKRDWEVRIFYIFWEQNKVADCLSKKALLHERGLKVIKDPPASLLSILWDDTVGQVVQRSLLSDAD